MSDPAALAQAIVSATRLQQVRYMQVVSMVLLVMDWACLIFDEIEHIWRADWGLVKILYFLSRYGPYLDTPLCVISYTHPNISPETCTTLYKISTSSTFFGIVISEAVLNLRTYALYAQSRRVIIPLWTLYTIIAIGGSVIVYYFLKSIVFGAPPVEGLPGCTLVAGSTVIFYDFVALLLYEFVIVVLTLKKSIKIVQSGVSSRVVKVLYRDSIMFFLCLLGLSLGNVLVLVLAPSEYLDLLDTLTRVLHSIICCRILLHIRTAAASHNRGLSSNTAISRGSTSTMRFKGVKRLISPFFTESSGSRTYMNTSGTSASAPVENIALRPLPPHHRRTQSVPLDSFSMPNIQTPARGYLRRHSDADYGMYESWDVR